jgi:hypothetical protein
MDKKSLGSDITKIYKIKPKGMSKPSKKVEEPEMEDEEEGGDPAEMLRQAADMIDEGNISEAYGVIDEAVEVCKEMHGEGDEEEYD